MNQEIEWINERWNKIDAFVEIAAKEHIEKCKINIDLINLYKFLYFCFSYDKLLGPAEKQYHIGLSYLLFKLPFELYQTNIENNDQNANVVLIDIISSFANSKNDKKPETNLNEIDEMFIETNADVQREAKRFLKAFNLVSEGKEQDVGEPLKNQISNIRLVRKMIKNNVNFPHFFYDYFSLIDKKRFQHIKDSRLYDWLYLSNFKKS